MNPSVVSCRAILYELGLQGKLTTDQLAKKWDNLKRRYKVGAGDADDKGSKQLVSALLIKLPMRLTNTPKSED